MSKDSLTDNLTAAERSKTNRLGEQSENRYRRFVEEISNEYVFYAHDREGFFTYISPSVLEVLGFHPESIIGLNWREIVSERYIGKKNAERVADKVTEESQLHQFTIEIRHAEGGNRLLDMQQRAILGSDGEVLSIEGIAKDITKAKRAAETIRKKEVHLAYFSRLATMGELVAGIAHEVHQPLHAAKTFAEAARRNLEAGLPDAIPTSIDCLMEISEAINRTAKIIRHLRAFTTTKHECFEQIDFREVAQGAAELSAAEAHRAGVRFRFDLASQVLPVQGDRVQLEQACVNLLINAFEAMAKTASDQREVLITSQSDGQEVGISFRDKGCGVKPVDQNKMFAAFYSTKPNGMGMGLSLCKSIAEAHSGKIQAHRNESGGMTFTFLLPFSKSSLKNILP